MTEVKSSEFNVSDGRKAVEGLTDRGFWNIMSHLEKKELVARASGRIGDYVYFEGFYLVEDPKKAML